MSRVTRHAKVGLVFLFSLLCTFVPLEASAVTTPLLIAASEPKVLITELQTNNESASEEFIELYNLTDSDIDFADTAHAGKDLWKLQFFSATATTNGTPDWTKPSATVSLSGVIPAHGYFVIAGNGYEPGGIDADQTYSSRLADTGGGLQVVDVTTTQVSYHDRVMWKQASSTTMLPTGVIASPPVKSSVQRQPFSDGTYSTETGELAAFVQSASITPKDMWQAPEAEPEPTPDPIDPSIELPEEPIAQLNVGLTAPTITELLPNPAAPLKDETDEFIELFNPNEQSFDLSGYTLEVGTTTLHDYTFPDSTVLEPGAYRAFYASVTRLSLTNSGGQARLLVPDHSVLNQTAPYETADEGMSWIFTGSDWQWSTAVTPSLVNVLAVPVIAAKTTSTAAKTAKTAAPKTSKTAAKKAATAKATTKKAKATTAKKKKAKKAPKTTLATTAASSKQDDRAPIHGGVLVAVVAIAVLYAAYEYRHDLQNRLYKLRRHRRVRAYAR